ncbi:MAG: hypothetical protein V1775_00160 [Bacteroidota bacterium]
MHLVKYRFLLGGYDLEMVTILHIIMEHGLKYYDKKLKWGAKLSEYKSVFNDDEHFVGIELKEDIPLPLKYIPIDHHNENRNRLSSIEQIAEMLNLELDRHQKLVAANDRGYIPAMEAMGATKEEIQKIRKDDKKAQGITKQDELLAEKSIRNHLTIEGDVTIVKSLTSHFSTITDRLFPYNKLLIYTDDELTYYGEGVVRLSREFRDLIIQGKAFTGGGDNGFLGISFKSFPTINLTYIKDKVISIIKH